VILTRDEISRLTTRPKYLLDTNVVSELRSRRPNERVLAFASVVKADSLFISVMTLGELQKGLALKRPSDAAAAARLTSWIDSLYLQFANRIVDLDLATATLWGELSAIRTRPLVDTLLAATAIVHNFTLVTRNTRNVEDTGVHLLNPWQP